jgi:hypothetical protein
MPGADPGLPVPGPAAPRGRHRPTGGSAGKGPLRGFPPAPGQPPPLYPPGQFSAWNRRPSPDSNGFSGPPGPGGAWPGGPGSADYGRPEAESPNRWQNNGGIRRGHRRDDSGYLDADYSALAVSEPAADVTSTQTWEAVGDNAPGGWAAPARAAASGPLPVAPRDRGLRNSGIHDTGIRDTGIRDTGVRDTGIRDTGIRDTGIRDTGRNGAIGSRERRDAAMQHSGLQERVSQPGLRPADPSPAPQSPGQRGRRQDRGPARGAAGTAAADATSPTMGQATQRAAAQASGHTAAQPALAPGTAGGRPAPGSARHGTRERPGTRKRRGRGRMLLGAALAVAVVVGGGAVYLELNGHHSAPPRAAGVKPTVAPGPPASLGQWGYITARTSDPVPLTLGELFPGKFTSGSLSYTMTVSKGGTNCTPALVGSQLQGAAQKAGCNQAMSASYLSSNPSQQVMATIGVLNLTDAAGSQSTGAAAGPSETIAQLPGPSGPTASLTKGTGIEAAEVKGHYLVLVWAEFANLQAPSTPAQKQELDSFISLLIEKTANVTLAIREVTGKPVS